MLALGGYLILDPVVGGNASFFVQTGLPAFLPVFSGGGIMIAAPVCMVAPSQRMFPAIFAALLAVASLPLANLGGFVVGMTLGIIGAGLCFALDALLREAAGEDGVARRASGRPPIGQGRQVVAPNSRGAAVNDHGVRFGERSA
ncbi:DUF6114 domain-containing protein [Nocardioides sp. B-3]|nr:DUF6114 domain-containing protein [Nocardioides sp. B-3]